MVDEKKIRKYNKVLKKIEDEETIMRIREDWLTRKALEDEREEKQ